MVFPARDEAILQGGRDRMRAILMTAATTIIGLSPLAFGGSRAGGLFYYPLALTVMGGLMSSSVLTLVVLPYVNLVLRWAARTGRPFLYWVATRDTPAQLRADFCRTLCV